MKKSPDTFVSGLRNHDQRQTTTLLTVGRSHRTRTRPLHPFRMGSDGSPLWTAVLQLARSIATLRRTPDTTLRRRNSWVSSNVGRRRGRATEQALAHRCSTTCRGNAADCETVSNTIWMYYGLAQVPAVSKSPRKSRDEPSRLPATWPIARCSSLRRRESGATVKTSFPMVMASIASPSASSVTESQIFGKCTGRWKTRLERIFLMQPSHLARRGTTPARWRYSPSSCYAGCSMPDVGPRFGGVASGTATR